MANLCSLSQRLAQQTGLPLTQGAFERAVSPWGDRSQLGAIVTGSAMIYVLRTASTVTGALAKDGLIKSRCPGVGDTFASLKLRADRAQSSFNRYGLVYVAIADDDVMAGSLRARKKLWDERGWGAVAVCLNGVLVR